VFSIRTVATPYELALDLGASICIERLGRNVAKQYRKYVIAFC
jgi:hypothetical protein